MKLIRRLIDWTLPNGVVLEAPAAEATPFALRQALCRDSGTHYYGDGGTIHSTGQLDVETYRGEVVAVWFRCCALPFQQYRVDRERAKAMRDEIPTTSLVGLELRDAEEKPEK